MLAVDTNILVRYVTDDDPLQARRAKRLIETNDVFIATTVVLEAEWVLRGLYRFTRKQIVAGLTILFGLPTVRLEHPVRVSRALGRAEAGMDFADALHLAAAEDCEAFITFDRNFAKAARGLAVPVRAA
jgi:predicted nucleic-acid-binding protein